MADREWLWADPIDLNFNSEPAYKEGNVSQWSGSRLYVKMKCTRVWLNQANEIVFLFLNWSPILLLECQCPAEFFSSKLAWVSIHINMDTFKNIFFSLCFHPHKDSIFHQDTLQSVIFFKSSFLIVVWTRKTKVFEKK